MTPPTVTLPCNIKVFNVMDGVPVPFFSQSSNVSKLFTLNQENDAVTSPGLARVCAPTYWYRVILKSIIISQNYKCCQIRRALFEHLHKCHI